MILILKSLLQCKTNSSLFCKVEDSNDIETVKASFSGDMVHEEKPVAHQETARDVKPQKTSFSRISPSAKLLLSEHGLDASSITASGPRGTLLKGDVLAAIKSGKGSTKMSASKDSKPPLQQVQPQTSASRSDIQQTQAFEDLPNTQIRKVTLFTIK